MAEPQKYENNDVICENLRNLRETFLGMPRCTVGEVLKRGTEYLASKNVDEAELNAEWLLAFLLDLPRLELRLWTDRPVSKKDAAAYAALIKRKGKGEPLSYITGRHNFMGLSLRINRDVLIPRPETELLVEHVLQLISQTFYGYELPSNPLFARPHPALYPRRGERGKVRGPKHFELKIADVGTGSGCIAIALARRLAGARVTATDVSEAALKTAVENAALQGVSGKITFLSADLLSGGKDNVASIVKCRGGFNLAGGRINPSLRTCSERNRFHLIVSNLPYVPTGDLRGLQKEVLFEPLLALDGGPDGLKVIKRLISMAKQNLVPGGWLCLETGINQAGRVMRLFKTETWERPEVKNDDKGIERFVFARLKTLSAKHANRH